MGKALGNIPVFTPARSRVAVKREAFYAAGSILPEDLPDLEEAAWVSYCTEVKRPS